MRLSLTLAVVLGVTAAGQQPVQFKGGVQLLTIDASVRDKSGSPVTDLQPSDFTVTLDGKRRTVIFAQYFHSEPSTIVASSDLTVGRYQTNTESPAGHVVVFAIDRDALPPGTERPILDSAAAMLKQLSAADSAGLVEIPGRSFDVTRDHGRVAEVLRSIVGMSPPRSSARNVAWDEAKGFERRDNMIIGRVMERECSSGDSFCPREVQARVREVLSYERAHAERLLAALTSVIKQLDAIRAPKHLVLVSAGVPFDVEFLDRYKMFEHAAAEARVTVDTIRPHEFVADASSDAKGSSGFDDPGIKAGMDTLATMTGGRVYAPAGTGAGVFTRLVSEVTSFYQLGIESDPRDVGDKLHDVKVHVNRLGLETVARPSIVAPPATPPSGLLDSALQQPIDVAGVPIAVSTYSVFASSGAERVVVAAEIGSPGGSVPTEWGVIVLREGKSVASTRGRIAAGRERPQIVMSTMELAPGSYRLRIGAVDADGGTGTLEIPFTAGAHLAANGARIGDLMLGVTSGNQLEPRNRVADSDEIVAVVHVAGPTAPHGTLQFIRGGTTTAAAAGPLIPVGNPGGTITLQANLDAGSLSPGRYTAIATVQAGEQVLGRVSRVVEVVPGAAPVSTNTSASGAPVEPLAPLTTDALAVEIMQRVGAYVERYGDAASVLVGVERYTQEAMGSVVRDVRGPTLRTLDGMVTAGTGTTEPPAGGAVRALTSEIALVRNTAAIGGWLAFRDVFEVDKKPVSDRGDRLRALFKEKTPDLEAAKRIDDENTRFNIGPVKRTFNVPTATLFFFTPANLRRFAFKSRGVESIDGVKTLVVDFHETAKPTLVMTAAGTDVPCSGTLWIDPADGHVLRTRLALTGYAGADSAATVEVTYQHHQEFDMWVPASMHEAYATQAGRATADAQYVDFHRFQTSAKIKK